MDTRRAGVIASSAHQNLPTYGHHVLQRFTQKRLDLFLFPSLKIDREQHVADSPNHSLYLIKLFSFSNLERNFGPDGSIGLSPSPHHLPPPRLPQPPQPQPRAPQQHTTHRDRQTHRQTERQTERQRDGERRQNPSITNDSHVRHFP